MNRSLLDIADLSPAQSALLELRLKKRRAVAVPQTIPRRPRVSNRIPCSFAQERLWFLEQLEAHTAVYNIPAAVVLRGELEVAALTAAFAELVRRHESLRTTFREEAGEVVQEIHGAVRTRLAVIDLSRLPEHERLAAAEQLTEQEARQPFDLGQGPLLRARLLRINGAEHRLLLTLHHIICDGWSVGILVRELGALYGAFSRGQESPLRELPVQYGDYAVWQRAQWAEGALAEQVSYWREQLRGTLPVLALPIDHPRPVVQSYRGRHEWFTLSPDLGAGLEELSRGEGVTLFMTLLAAFQTLLYRYTGQTDVLVGTPVAGRTRTEVEELIGMFVNTLVLRTEVVGSESFQMLLGRVREVCLEAYAHQEAPFEQVVEAVQPARALSHTPLFQVMFALQNAPLPKLELAQLSLHLLPVDSGSVKFDLSLSMAETSEGLAGLIEYSTDLFEPASIVRLAGHFQKLLESIVENPASQIAELSILTDAEDQQHAAWNKTQSVYRQPQLIHELFQAQVERTPDAPALSFENQQLSYEELNQRANQFAHYLQTLGVGPETPVGLYLERSLEMMVGLLGILKAGGAYVPLDPSYPQARLVFMMENAQTHVVVTQRHLLNQLPRGGAAVVCLDSDWPTIAQSVCNFQSPVTADNLAYVIYTSGSTGQPKGAMNTHRGICNRLLWMQEAYRLDETDTVLQKTPLSFDVSVWELFWPLMCGARMVIAEPYGHQDSAYLVRVIRQQRVTTLHFVPSMLDAFLEEEGVEECRSLRRVFCSGEALPYEHIKRFYRRVSADLHNLYGPTEAAVDVTYWACPKQGDSRTVLIGKPIANTQIHLLDAALQTVPVNVPGELHIGGVGVGRGYLRQPALTAERFIPDPLSDERGARLYSTGDLARCLPDGQIEYLGRNDYQVKVRGFRIELSEIEAALSQHPVVREAVVIARKDDAARNPLVAYVVSNQIPPPSVPQLHQYLRERLPIYMVPASFILLESLPLLPNGKVDRLALPLPERVREDAVGEFVAPRNATEEKLASIWRECLALERVSVHDNFFEIGGHSLSALKVVSKLRVVFKIELPLRRLFEALTIATLAAVIDTARTDGTHAVPSAIAPNSREQYRVRIASSQPLEKG